MVRIIDIKRDQHARGVNLLLCPSSTTTFLDNDLLVNLGISKSKVIWALYINTSTNTPERLDQQYSAPYRLP